MSEEQRTTDDMAEATQQPEPLPESIASVLGARLLEGKVVDGVAYATVHPAQVLDALRLVSSELDEPYSHLSDMCGVDRPDCIEVVYHLFRPLSNDALVMRVKLARSNPHLATATGLWATANWAEREIAEMFGVTFSGHPDPRLLLLPDELAGACPLRKDFRYPQEHPYLSRDPLHEDFPDVAGRVRVDPPTPEEPETS